MEIRIKTAEEFWRDKVSIEISGTAAEVQTVGQHITRGRTAGYWADACERAEREVRELKDRAAGDAGTIEALRERVADLGQQLLTAHQAREIETRRAQGYDHDRHTERDRADRITREHAQCDNRVKLREADAETWRRQRDELERELAESRDLVEAKNGVIESLQDNLATSAGEVRRLKEEMERRFTTGQVEDAKAGAREDARAQLQREVIAPLEDKLARIHTAVLGTELARELTTYRDSSAAMLLVEALTEVRRITGVTSV